MVIIEYACQDLDMNGVARGEALDISKTFDGVWHACLPHKLKGYDVSARIMNGYPQATVLEPPLFPIFTDDLPKVISFQLCIYAEHTIHVSIN